VLVEEILGGWLSELGRRVGRLGGDERVFGDGGMADWERAGETLVSPVSIPIYTH
jgi:hypothetical protein